MLPLLALVLGPSKVSLEAWEAGTSTLHWEASTLICEGKELQKSWKSQKFWFCRQTLKVWGCDQKMKKYDTIVSYLLFSSVNCISTGWRSCLHCPVSKRVSKLLEVMLAHMVESCLHTFGIFSTLVNRCLVFSHCEIKIAILKIGWNHVHQKFLTIFWLAIISNGFVFNPQPPLWWQRTCQRQAACAAELTSTSSHSS